MATETTDDDNQMLRFKGASGPFAVSVYAPTGHHAPDETALCVLVKDRNTQAVLLDATVDVTAQPGTHAVRTKSTIRANHAASENKLMQTAKLRLAA